MKNVSLFCLIVFVFSSCYYSNAIYFDVAKQSVNSCNPKGIRQLYIDKDSSRETYLLVWEDKINEVPKVINIKSIKGYFVYKGWNRKQISINEFKLSPLSCYTFDRAQGDAASYKIKVWTDEFGNIKKTSKGSCDE